MACFLDTNILIYAQSLNPIERTKREIAERLLEQADCTLSVQVLQEFYVQSTRPSRPYPIAIDVAQDLARSFKRFRVLDMSSEIVFRALEMSNRYRFSYWDSAIIAAALMAKCDILFTEDLHHGQIIEGLRIINPFKDDAPIDG